MPDAPLRYQVLQWARDMGISYVDALKLPMAEVNTYLEMRDLETEFGPQQQQNQQDQGIIG